MSDGRPRAEGPDGAEGRETSLDGAAPGPRPDAGPAGRTPDALYGRDPAAGPLARVPYGTGVEWAVFVVGVLGAVLVWALWPSAGNYDSVLDLVWAREILDGGRPGFEAYAASTPHPLWVALGLPVVGVLGDEGDRALVLVSSLSLAVLAAGTARLGRIAGEAVAAPGLERRTGRATAAVAGLLLLSSFAFGLLAAKGYLDVPFLALVAWAAAWALRHRRAWKGPALLLLLAGLLRPEAWILAGAYWLWCSVDGSWGARGAGRFAWPGPVGRALARRRVGDGAASAEARPRRAGLPGRTRHLLLVLVAPVLWIAMDLWATGNPFHSLTATSQLADDLGRDRGITKAPRLLVTQLVDQSRPPVFVAGLAGAGVLLLAPRLGLRAAARPVRVVLVALLLAGVATFLAAGVGGLSLIPRYLSVPVVALTVLAALAATAWVGLPRTGDEGRAAVADRAAGDRGSAEGPAGAASSDAGLDGPETGGAVPGADLRGAPTVVGLPLRTAWAGVVLAVAVLGVGAYATVKRDSVTSIRAELRFLADAREDVRALIDDRAVRRAARCGPVSLPTYRLVPEIRLRLDADGREVLARSDPRARRLGAYERGVAITVDEDAADGKWRQRYGQADGVPRTTKPAPPGFRRIATSGAFTAWARCD